MKAILESIAFYKLGIKDMANQEMDTIFTVTVPEIEEALQAAYHAGRRNAGRRNASTRLDNLATEIQEILVKANVFVKRDFRTIQGERIPALKLIPMVRRLESKAFWITECETEKGAFYLAAEDEPLPLKILFTKDEIIETLKKW